MSPMLDQAPCGPAVPCLSRQARAAVMVRLRGEADAGHRSAVSGHRSPVKQVIGRQCHSGVSVIRVNTGMVNFRKFLLPNKAVIFLKIFREIYICPNSDSGFVVDKLPSPSQHCQCRNSCWPLNLSLSLSLCMLRVVHIH